MSAVEKLNEYINTVHPRANDNHYIKLVLDAICEGSIRQIQVEGATYEVYADIVETEE